MLKRETASFERPLEGTVVDPLRPTDPLTRIDPRVADLVRATRSPIPPRDAPRSILATANAYRSSRSDNFIVKFADVVRSFFRVLVDIPLELYRRWQSSPGPIPGLLMGLGGLLAEAPQRGVNSREQYEAELRQYNDSLKSYDEALAARDEGRPHDEALLQDRNLQILHAERQAFIQLYGAAYSPVSSVVLSDGPLTGQTIGNYKLLGRIGSGGMADVYLCENISTGKKHAIKLLNETYSGNQTVVEKFRTEARKASATNNVHIVEYLDGGRSADGREYIVMEYLQGNTLGALIDNTAGPLSEAHAIHIALQIADGLGAAHKAGIVHGDVKPDNIFLIKKDGDPDFVKVLDFGIAETVKPDGASDPSKTGFHGTPEYVSPEHILQGKVITPQSDVYSLAIILYEMLTGRVPYPPNPEHGKGKEGADKDKAIMLGILYRHVKPEEKPTPPSELNPQITPELERVILKALEKNPQNRYQSMADFVAALKEASPDFSQNVVDSSRPDLNLVPRLETEPPLPRSRLPMILGTSGIIGLIASLAFFIGTRRAEKGNASDASTGEAAKIDAAPKVTVTPLEVTPDHPPAPSIKQVKLQIRTPGAQVFVKRGESGSFVEVKTGRSGSLSLPIEQGEPIVIEVRRKGYQTQRVPLEFSSAKDSLTVALQKIRRNSGTNPGSGSGSGSSGGGLFIP